MKQIASILCVLLCLSLAGCGKSPAPLPAAGTGFTATDAYRAVLHPGITPFSTVSKEMKGYTSSEVGFYEFVQDEAGNKIIYYTDFATHQRVVLCAQPSCAHNSEACTAWIDATKGEIMLAAAGGKLAVIYTNFYHMEEASSPSIEVIDPNGANKQLLCTFDANVDISSDVLANDTHLILKLKQTQRTDDAVLAVYSVVAVSLATGENAVLYQTGPEDADTATNGELWLNVAGATDTGIVFFLRRQGEFNASLDDVDAAAVAQRSTMIFTYYELPYDGTAPKKVYEHSAASAIAGVYPSGFYVIERAGEVDSLARVDTRTGEKTVLVENLAQSFGFPAFENTLTGLYAMTAEVRGNVIVQALTGTQVMQDGNIESVERNWKAFAVHSATAAVTELTLTNHYHAATLPLEIFAQFGGQLFVLARVDETISAQALPTTVFHYGILSKEDYLASRANITLISSVTM